MHGARTWLVAALAASSLVGGLLVPAAVASDGPDSPEVQSAEPVNSAPSSVYEEPDDERKLPEPREPKRPPKGSKAAKALAKAEQQIAEQIATVDESLTHDRVSAKSVPVPEVKPVTGAAALRASDRMTAATWSG